MEEPGRLQSRGSLESDTTERLHFHFSLSCIGEGNGNPLQSSCLKNPRDGGAWWAAIYGVAQSQTRLKRLSSSSGKEPACQCRKCSRSRFNSWIGKIFWRKKWQPTTVFLPGESQGWEAWSAAVYGVAQNRTQLKWCDSSSSSSLYYTYLIAF